jgi:hypothetical protein
MRNLLAGARAHDGQRNQGLIRRLGSWIALRLSGAGKLLLAAMVIVGVSGIATVAATTPAFAAGTPTVADGYGAFGNSPVFNLTGCTGASGQTTLTCTNNPITVWGSAFRAP